MAKHNGHCDGPDCPYTGYYTVPGHKDKMYCRPCSTSLLLDLSKKEATKLKKKVEIAERALEHVSRNHKGMAHAQQHYSETAQKALDKMSKI